MSWADECVPTPGGVAAPTNKKHTASLTTDQKLTRLGVTPKELEVCEVALGAYQRCQSEPCADEILGRLKLDPKRHRLLMGLVVTMAREDAEAEEAA